MIAAVIEHQTNNSSCNSSKPYKEKLQRPTSEKSQRFIKSTTRHTNTTQLNASPHNVVKQLMTTTGSTSLIQSKVAVALNITKSWTWKSRTTSTGQL